EARLCPQDLGDHAEAVEAMLDEALKDEPGNAVFNAMKGSMLVARDDHEKAVPFLQCAIKDLKHDDSVIHDLGTALRGASRYNDALPYLKKTYNKWPNDIYARFAYAHALYKTGSNTRALKLFSKCIAELDDLMP